MFAILFFIMAAYPGYAQESSLLYYSPQYTSLSRFKDGIAIYTVNEQLGLLDTNGKESPLRTGEYVWHGANTVIVRDGDRIYGYSYSKEKLFECSCTSVYGIHENMIVIGVDESIGVINFNGETVFPCGAYDMVRIKDSSAIWYSSNDVWYEYSLLDGKRREMSYTPLVSLDDSLCIGIDTAIGLYEEDEAIVEAEYSSYYIFDDKYVFVGAEGACIYDAATKRVQELAGRKILDCDELGYTYYSIPEDMVYYVTYDNAVSYKYDMLFAGVLSEEYMVICSEQDQYSYGTRYGAESTQLTWNMAYRFEEGYALCYDYVDNEKSDTQWYIINKNFEIVKTLEYDVYIDAAYPASTNFSNGYIRTIEPETGRMGFIRLDGFDFDGDIVLGDVTNDGKVNMADVMALRRYLVNSITYPLTNSAAADVTGEGNINMADVMAIRRYLVNSTLYPLQ